MKILYYSPHPHINLSDPSGYGTHMREIIRAFRELGHEVKLLIMGGEKRSVQSGKENKTRTRRLMKGVVPSFIWETARDMALIRFDERAVPTLEEAVVEFGPDIIYERGYFLMRSGAMVAKKNNIRHVLELNAPYAEEKREMNGRSLMDRYSLKRIRDTVAAADRIIVVSTALKDYYSKLVPKVAGRIQVVTNAFNPDHIQIDENRISLIRARYGLTEDTVVIGFSGSLFPYHGVDVLIESFPTILKEFPGARLMIVGDGYVVPALKERSRELGISDQLIFTGNVEPAEVFNHIAVMNIAIMPKSNWYGSPVKIFEYGAMKKPVIAPDVGPVREVMEDGVDGILVKQGSVSDLSGAITRCLKQPGLGDAMAKNFCEKVFAQHTWKCKAQAVIDNLP